MLIDKMNREILARKCPIVIGLDPRFELIPEEIRLKNVKAYGESFKAVSESILEFNKGIIDAVIDTCFIFKPQIAFYEQYGIDGLIAYQETCTYVKSQGGMVIGDVKRGDIGSTAEAYAKGHLGMTQVGEKKLRAFETDFVTVNPYLGSDSLDPFIEEAYKSDKGIFVLVKTSNPSSGELQNLYVGNTRVYERVAQWVSEYDETHVGETGYAPVGAVVGATYPEEIEKLRMLMPRAIFLVPGYGAQGGGAKDVINAFDENGLGALVSNSRGILYAYRKNNGSYQKEALKAVVEMKNAIENELSRKKK